MYQIQYVIQSHVGILTEVLRYPFRYAGVCVTGTLQPRSLMHSALGESAVPAGIEVITIRTLPAVAVSIASKVKHESLSTDNKLALDVSNAIIQI